MTCLADARTREHRHRDGTGPMKMPSEKMTRGSAWDPSVPETRRRARKSNKKPGCELSLSAIFGLPSALHPAAHHSLSTRQEEKLAECSFDIRCIAAARNLLRSHCMRFEGRRGREKKAEEGPEEGFDGIVDTRFPCMTDARWMSEQCIFAHAHTLRMQRASSTRKSERR
jgi:hypothetical protein